MIEDNLVDEEIQVEPRKDEAKGPSDGQWEMRRLLRNPTANSDLQIT